MTNKEALECIVVDLTPKAKEHNKEEIEQVKKSLEVLEIFKRNIYSSDYSISIILDDLRNYDDFKKIKEWYENGKIN